MCFFLFKCGGTKQDFLSSSHSNFQDWEYTLTRKPLPQSFKFVCYGLKKVNPVVCLLCNSPWPFFSPLWGHCRARPCSWSRGALEAPAGPAAGHWPSRPPCSCPARVYPAPPSLAFFPLPCRPVVPVSRCLFPEWACGCRWTPLWLTSPHTASLKQVVNNFGQDGGNNQWGLQPLWKLKKNPTVKFQRWRSYKGDLTKFASGWAVIRELCLPFHLISAYFLTVSIINKRPNEIIL